MMDFGSKLEELQLTTDELDRFSKALKDEKFRVMLNEYAEEISKPENKKKYEEEITQLEQERGMGIQFVHPKPHHVLKTSINGTEKCFINICSNDLISKSSCKAGRAEDGRVGQQWSLPYSLVPGRSDRDTKGNKCTIYDAVFHPDTLYIAGKKQQFMDLVNSTAIQGIEDAFKVKLDTMNAKILKIKYKGVPHPAVIRKPIAGHPVKVKATAYEDIFPINYPYSAANGKPQTTAVPHDYQNYPKESLPQHSTKPHYTVKYRSVIDLQDYRCSRDSAPSPHPKEIVVTIDLPLIRTAGDVDLNITERTLVLKSQKPAYELELQLSYPVDEDKGDAKFIKAKKQLIITLPVLKTKEYIVIHKDGMQPEEDKDEMENVNKVEEARKSASADQDVQNDMNSDLNLGTACLTDMPVKDEEGGLQFSSDRADSCKTDWMKLYCDSSRSGNTTEETEIYNLSEKEYFHLNDESTALSNVGPVAVSDSGSHTRQCHLIPAETADVLQDELTGAQLQSSDVVSHSIKKLDDIPNVIQSGQPFGKSVDKLSVVSVCPSQLKSALTVEEDTTGSLSFSEETGMLPEEQVVDSFPAQPAPLIEEIKMPLHEQLDNVQSSEQNQTDFTINIPAILREKNSEDGSEVIISNHATSPALSFQNSLWFELD